MTGGDEPVIDVRPLLAAGEEPLQIILDLAQATPPGGGFVVVAPFDPAPLRALLAASGFAAEARTPAPNCWRVRFSRPAEHVAAAAAVTAPSKESR